MNAILKSALAASAMALAMQAVAQSNYYYDRPGYAPAPYSAPYYRRRYDERLYQANVTSVRAVVGASEQRCWIERGQGYQPPQGNANVPGAIAGAVIGGILGHQIGNGRGQDIATVGGAVAGGFIGSNVGGPQYARGQDVQRCENVSSQAQPSFWDVTYNFQGVEHRVQMSNQPGPTITVNEQGEPRS